MNLGNSGCWAASIRSRAKCEGGAAELLPSASAGERMLPALAADTLFHPKYHVPSDCFAYVGNPADPGTGSSLIDSPPVKNGAQGNLIHSAQLSEGKSSSRPGSCDPGRACAFGARGAELGRLPFQGVDAAPELALIQLGHLDEVMKGY